MKMINIIMIMINYQYNDVNENRSFNKQKATYKLQFWHGSTFTQ